ncbi:hypothetical protein LTT66_33270 [Nocardia gipuzkoensis]|nr:hypothetical protein [Nocardia gipuzkoensis]UGT67985.1 hypothetical protein LTT66_33270 [Nocardia gipuzkoensis]
MNATTPSGEASTAARSRAEVDAAWVAGTRRSPAARCDAHTGKDAV